MPLPVTESLSVTAPMLYLRVSPRPFSRSAIKKRLSFSMNFGLGTLTNGIRDFRLVIFDFRFYRFRLGLSLSYLVLITDGDLWRLKNYRILLSQSASR